MEFTEISNLINNLKNEIELLNDEMGEFVKINNSSFCNGEIESLKEKINDLNENNNQIINKL